MSEKNLETLIVKIVKKTLKKEIGKLKKDNLPIVFNQTDYPLDGFIENSDNCHDKCTTEEIIDDIYTNPYVTIDSTADAQLDRNLRELKFKQELRKDWISFIVRDVIVYSATIIFIFATSSFYLFSLINR